MKISLVFGMVLLTTVVAEPPKKRSISGNGGADAGKGMAIVPKGPKVVDKKVITTQYIAVSNERTWKSADGKSIKGTLVIFEQIDKKAPVIIKDQSVKILKGKKSFVLPLKKLSREDQAFVNDIDQKAKAAFGVDK